MQRGEGISYNPVEAFTWFKRSADAGDAAAQCSVGHALETGEGVEEDKVLGAVYYRRSADQGFATALHNLGNCYANGIGLPRDPSAAVLWMKRALDAGYPDASKNLAGFAASLSPSEVPAMGAGVLRALLDGLGVHVPPGAEKPDLVALVLSLGEVDEEGAE